MLAMAETQPGSEILPTDRRGRVRVTRDRRDQLLNEFEKSQLSAAQFAQVTGLKYSTFAAWVNKRRRRRATQPPELPAPARDSAVHWLETVIDGPQGSLPASTSALKVRLPSGATMEITQASQADLAAAFLRAWEKKPC